MLLVGILSVVYWKKKTNVEMNYFFYGGFVWLIAISIKVMMDYTLSPFLYEYLSLYGMLAAVIVSGIYIGIRTGILESGISYSFIIKSKLKRAGWKEAIAFGIGFGATESIFIGFSSFTSILVFVIFPTIVESIPPEYQLQLLSQLNMGTEIIFAPILERLFVLFAHIFSTVLVFMAVRSKKMFYLVISILYKTLLDGIIPWLNYTLGTGDIVSIYLIEVPIIIIGLIGYFGIRWLKPRFNNTTITGKIKSKLKHK